MTVTGGWNVSEVDLPSGAAITVLGAVPYNANTVDIAAGASLILGGGVLSDGITTVTGTVS